MDEVKEYIENVNAGIIEGEYGENILKGCKDAKINAFLENPNVATASSGTRAGLVALNLDAASCTANPTEWDHT